VPFLLSERDRWPAPTIAAGDGTRTKSRNQQTSGLDKNLHARPAGYPELLKELKGRIRAARVKAALAVNAEFVALYLSRGRDILARQERNGWGAQVLEPLSRDLR